MKYIFPRQFGLHNVFTSEVNVRETVQPFKDYTLREEEINDQKLARRGTHAMLRPKIPKRLRGLPMELVQKLQKRSQNLPYTELLRHYCPATVSHFFPNPIAKSIDWLQKETGPPRFPPFSPETREEIVSQTFVTQVADSDQNLPFPKAGDRPLSTSQSSTVAQNGKVSRKVCFLDYSTPCASVSAFCRATLRRLIPKSFFGEGDDRIVNERQLMYQIDRFVRLSRFESLSLHEVCKGFKVHSLCPEIIYGCNLANESRSSLYGGSIHHPPTRRQRNITLHCQTCAKEPKFCTNLFITFLTPCWFPWSGPISTWRNPRFTRIDCSTFDMMCGEV